MNGDRLGNALDKWWVKAEQKQFLYGTVGRVNPDNTVTIVVPQRPDFVYVVMTDSTLAQARNQRRVPLRSGLPVKMRRENGTLVILEEDRTGLLENDPNAPGTVYSVNGQTGDVLLDFIDLTDVPTAYTGHANKVVAVKVAEDGLEFITNASDVAAAIVAAADKATPVDADLFALVDSAASNVLKKLTWANLKATLKVYLDTLYLVLLGKAGGQTASGGTAASENLVLDSTAHATKGVVALQPSGGHVGIGTITPGVDVVGTTDISAAPILQADGATPRVVLRGSTNTSINFIDTGAGANVKWIRFISDGGFSEFQSLADAGTVQADNILVLDHSNGNIGIGAATPGVDVVGTTDITNVPLVQIDGANPRLILRGSADAGINLIDTGAGSNVKWMRLVTDGGFTEFQSVADAGTLQVDNILVMDHNTGQVGINTSTLLSGKELTVNGDADISGEMSAGWLESSSWQSLGFGHHFYSDGGSPELMVLAENGRLGIGVGVPSHELDVAGSMRSTGNVNVGDGTEATAITLVLDGAAGSARSVAFRTGGVNRWLYQVTATAEGGSNAGSNFALLRRADDGSAIDTAFFINRATGNVGISTATPQVLTHLVSSAVAGATYNAGDPLTIERNASSNINIITGTTHNGGVIFSDADARARGAFFYSHADDALIYWTAGTEKARITSGGNLGIGETTPTGKLHVDQNGAAAAIPVLVLRQQDVDQDMIEFMCTIGTGNAIEAVGAKTLTTTHFIKVTLPGGLTRYFPVGTIA